MIRPPSQLLRYGEYAFTIALLIFYSGGPLTVILTGGFSQGDQQVMNFNFPVMRQLFTLSYLAIALLLSLRWQRALSVTRRSFCVVPLLLWAAASMVWSDFPQITQTRMIALIATSLFGLYMATCYSAKQQLRLLGLAFVGIVTLSFIYALVLPKYGIMGGVHTGDWRGIYTHKNTLGKFMSLGISVLLLNLLVKTEHKLERYIYGLGLVGASALMVLSGSSGALVNTVLLLALMAVCQLLRLHTKLLISSASALVCGGIFLLGFAYVNLGKLALALGKDPTLTGRTEIWAQVIPKIQERPLLGYGYQAFWQEWGSASTEILYGRGWMVPHAHNGFLDLTLDLGLIGLGLFLFGFILTLVRALAIFRHQRNLEILWPVLLLFFLVLANLAENTMLRRNDLTWVMYCSASFMVYSTPLRSRQSLQPGEPVTSTATKAVSWAGMNPR